ncbi:MAG: sodium/solute symporter [Armatimonadetes bacterium]|nr:sodium/solute symporter [Armatimonadota bacterium]
MRLAIHPIDIVIVIAYLVGIVALGCWGGLRQRKSSKGSDYFLAGKSLSWTIIGLALFSTNISTIHLVSLAQEGYVNGLAYGNFEWMAAFTLIALSLFFAPFYIRANVATLPDFLEKRYSRSCRDWLAIVSIISAIFIHIGFSLYTGAVVLEGLFGFNIMLSIIAVAVLTGIYTIVGGLMAVVLTESIQTIILLIGAVCITAIGFLKVGGWSGLAASVDPVKLTLLRSSSDPAGLPWYSVFLGYPIIGLWYWCADQTIVQRVLGAKDENHARVGPLFAAFIKILPVFIFVLPGTICLGLINQGILPNTLSKSEDTYAFLITQILPIGLRGVVAAALLAALMSTVSGALNSIATLFSYDIVKRWRPETSDRALVNTGRIVTFVAMIAAIAWSPCVSHFKSIFQGVTVMICYIAPPITTVFLWGIFTRRASARGAILTLWWGFALGFVVFLLDWFKSAPVPHAAQIVLRDWLHAGFLLTVKDGQYVTSWTIPPMMATFYLFVICSVILGIVSWLKPQKHTPETEALIWKNPLDALRSKAWPGIGNYKLLSAIVFVTMVLLYTIFR